MTSRCEQNYSEVWARTEARGKKLPWGAGKGFSARKMVEFDLFWFSFATVGKQDGQDNPGSVLSPETGTLHMGTDGCP